MTETLASVQAAGPQAPSTDPLSKTTEVDPAELGRKRFTIAVLIGVIVIAVPYVWIACDQWTGKLDPFRSVSPSNFYELQAHALAAGRLYMRPGSLGIEAFRHDGRQYTYFGLFPSLIRMPIMAVTQRLDGKMTGPSIFLAWVMTAVFSSVLIWRIRVIAWGEAVVTRAEAAGHGILMASIMGGSVLMFLGADPYVYNEDFAWSVALTTGSIFALLGVLERPSWRRVAACGLLVLATILDRSTTGYACVIGALIVAGWFAFARSNRESRRWAFPMFLVGMVPLAVSCVVTYAKFGIPFGLPMADQVWTSINAHRRYFLAANGGKAFSVAFLPSTLTAYFQPAGIHLTSVFPYVALPTSPARGVGSVVLDQTYPTASAPASMPLLFLLACWGVVTSFRRHGPGRVYLTRVVILVAGGGAVGVLVWGYIAERYLADILPLLIVGSAIGMVELWRLLATRSRGLRVGALCIIVALGAYGVAANVSIGSAPTAQFNQNQLQNFISAQESFSGGALASQVITGSTMPYWAPAGKLFIANGCSGLYYSTGFSYNNSPGQQLQHQTWLPVELAPGIDHLFRAGFNTPLQAGAQPVTLLTYGSASVLMQPVRRSAILISVLDPGAPSVTWPVPYSGVVAVEPHRQYLIDIRTDPVQREITVTFGKEAVIHHYLAGTGPAIVHTFDSAAGSQPPWVAIKNLPPHKPRLQLCRSLAQSVAAQHTSGS
jgi:hypothetical protein